MPVIAPTTTADPIMFYYETDNIFSICRVMSSYKAEGMVTESGESMLERYSITEDEKDIFKVFLKKAVYECGMKFRKLTSGISDGIFYDTTLDTNSGLDNASSGFQINNYDAYNQNMLDYVDEHAEWFLINHVLAQWYRTRNVPELAQIQDADLRMARANLDHSLFQFYKPLINS